MKILRGILDYCKLNKHLYKYSSKDIEKYQLKAIKKLLNFARENSEFYKKLYANCEINSIDDFKKLSTINKKIMLDNFNELNTCGLNLNEVTNFAVSKEQNKDYYGYYLNKYVVGLSSGTSGNKGIYITPKSLTTRLPYVFLARSGISLQQFPFKILFLLRVFSQGFNDINSPFIKLKYLSTMTEVDEIIGAINSLKINILMAPPSMLRILLPYAKRINIKIATIVTYAEVLCDEDRKIFIKTFNTKLIQIYQASEGQIGSSCKCGNLHINEDLVFVELYDKYNNLVNAPNEVAEKMIITNLVNFSQPLIRYEMNDLIMLDEKCECGSNFRTIKKVLGRNDDIIFLNNIYGVKQHIFPDLFSRWIITSSDDIREFKILEKDESIIIFIDTLRKNCDKNRIRELLQNRIVKELKEFSIENINLTITFKELELPNNMSKYKRFEKI